MGRDENVIIFRDTEKMCNENSRLKESIRKARDGQKLILTGEPLPSFDRSKYTDRVSLTVSKKRTLEAAAAYKNMRVAVHNFASATNPGGLFIRIFNRQRLINMAFAWIWEMERSSGSTVSISHGHFKVTAFHDAITFMQIT